MWTLQRHGVVNVICKTHSTYRGICFVTPGSLYQVCDSNTNVSWRHNEWGVVLSVTKIITLKAAQWKHVAPILGRLARIQNQICILQIVTLMFDIVSIWQWHNWETLFWKDADGFSKLQRWLSSTLHYFSLTHTHTHTHTETHKHANKHT